jgi:hypothetical protein
MNNLPSVSPKRRPQSSLTVNPIQRRLNVYTVTEDELETLYTSGNYRALDISLFGVAFGAALSLGATLVTVDITAPVTFAGFLAAMILSVVGSIFFLVRSIIAWRRAARTLMDIKRSATQS